MEIAGSLKKKKKRKNYDNDDTNFVKSHVSRFSRRALEADTTLFCLWIAGYWPVSDFGLVLKAWLGILAELLGGFSVRIHRFDRCHSYTERLPTL